VNLFERPVVRALGRSVVGAVVLLAVLAFVGLGVGPRTGQYRTLTVLSGSMRPSFAPGDLLVVTPKPTREIGVGDVITYAVPVGDHHVESHRVVSVRWRGGAPIVRTKGDANARPDPWTAQLHGATVWRTSLVVPKVGDVILWLRAPLIHTFLVLLVPALLVAFGLVSIWTRTDGRGARRASHARSA
jgi:signal peptidase